MMRTRRVACLLPILLSAFLTAALASTDLLRNGSFEVAGDRGVPTGWEVGTGARTLDAGASSSWAVLEPGHDGMRALRLSGDDATAEWLSLESAPVAVPPLSRLRLTGWIRTQDVRQQERQFENCNIGLSLLDAQGGRLWVEGRPVVGTRPLLGTNDWTRVERTVAAPEGAVQARVIAFLSMSGTAWFDGVELALLEVPPWRVRETEHFRFHDLPGAALPEWALRKNKEDLAELGKTLGVETPSKIDFFYYPDVARKAEITGRGGNAHVEGDHTIHSIWPVERHEIVHLLLQRIGEPESSLFGEGIAVYLAGPWHDRPPAEWAREYAGKGVLPRIANLLDGGIFRETDDMISYPVAGSFVSFLVERYGMARFKQAYPAGGDGRDPERFRTRLREVYGASLEELETAWLAALDGKTR